MPKNATPNFNKIKNVFSEFTFILMKKYKIFKNILLEFIKLTKLKYAKNLIKGTFFWTFINVQFWFS